MTHPPSRRAPSRRAVLGLAGGTAGLAGLAAVGGLAVGRSTAPDPGLTAERRVYPFTGAHQAGIVTPQQERVHLAAFDVTTTDRAALVALLQRWTTLAARLTQGLLAGPDGFASGPYDAPPDDTGEAADLPASGLTITVGFGRSLFLGADRATDRFGLASRLPDGLIELPHFPGDDLDPARSDGDLLVQACADDPQVAVHAVRALSRAAFGTARVRWTQLGYGRTSATTTAQSTPRNLFGFKDGTANIKAEEPDALADHVWVQPGDGSVAAAWLTGGTYLVGRRIRMTIETWDRTSLREQETVIGRTKREGAPLSGGGEHTAPDLTATGTDGAPLIDPDSHVHLAHPSSNHGARMLRRGYTFTDGNDALGRLDAGLYFLAYVRDPRVDYVPVQDALARHDRMNEYIRHTASALFAIPPGVPDVAPDGSLRGAYLGSTLLA
ncbi:MAG: deferrochelatase/peroxidase EfeB [Actinomycetales bacterium]|nr:deferrochelatase/peroxidase EfeB [Actinomycetales bacterium]